MHCSQQVLLGRLAHGILLVVCQDYHILSCISEIAVQVCRHILDIIDAPSQLTLLSKVIDPNQQSFSSPCAVRVLKVISLGCAGAEALLALGRRRWGVVISLDVGILID